MQLLQLDPTSSVAFFSVGAPGGLHGDWNVRAAMNQTDLSSWMPAGSYVVKAQGPHRNQFGMSASLQRDEGGNAGGFGPLGEVVREADHQRFVRLQDAVEVLALVAVGNLDPVLQRILDAEVMLEVVE
jgi:hypothetical protein